MMIALGKQQTSKGEHSDLKSLISFSRMLFLQEGNCLLLLGAYSFIYGLPPAKKQIKYHVCTFYPANVAFF